MAVVKDKHIKIFKLVTTRDSEGYEKTTKKYIHPIDSKLMAHYKDLRTSEIVANKQSQDDTEAIFTVNRRLITKDMYIEYNRRTFGLITYQITGVDGWDDTSGELKLGAKKLNAAPSYDNIEGTDWNGNKV